VAVRAAGLRPWQTVYGLFRRWQLDGTWAQILAALQGRADAAGLITGTCRWIPPSRGRTSMRPERVKGDLQAEPPAGEPADHGLGRSRGGLTTKIHLACEQGQKPLSIVVTAGQRSDSPQFQAVLEAIAVPRTSPGRPRLDRTGCWPTRPTGRARIALTYGDAGSRAPSPSRPTGSATAGTRAGPP
jgi:hypothetical protein